MVGRVSPAARGSRPKVGPGLALGWRGLNRTASPRLEATPAKVFDEHISRGTAAAAGAVYAPAASISRFVQLWLAAGQAEEAVLQRGVVGNVDLGPEDADGSPLLGVGLDLVPETLGEIGGKGAVDADGFGDIVDA